MKGYRTNRAAVPTAAPNLSAARHGAVTTTDFFLLPRRA